MMKLKKFVLRIQPLMADVIQFHLELEFIPKFIGARINNRFIKKARQIIRQFFESFGSFIMNHIPDKTKKPLLQGAFLFLHPTDYIKPSLVATCFNMRTNAFE